MLGARAVMPGYTTAVNALKELRAYYRLFFRRKQWACKVAIYREFVEGGRGCRQQTCQGWEGVCLTFQGL